MRKFSLLVLVLAVTVSLAHRNSTPLDISAREYDFAYTAPVGFGVVEEN